MVGVLLEPDLDLDEVVHGEGFVGGERLRSGGSGGISAVGRRVGIGKCG